MVMESLYPARRVGDRVAGKLLEFGGYGLIGHVKPSMVDGMVERDQAERAIQAAWLWFLRSQKRDDVPFTMVVARCRPAVRASPLSASGRFSSGA
jgi:hypothetical protein